MIVRDEADCLAACLASVMPLDPELVVVDTGSHDETPAIAAGFGARVLHHPWNDDFAGARNVSLAQARGDWILVIDADEHLDPV
ncbi:MAG: glycosyltransferase, partial [Candidatus Sericytochromatia bacterium]